MLRLNIFLIFFLFFLDYFLFSFSFSTKAVNASKVVEEELFYEKKMVRRNNQREEKKENKMLATRRARRRKERNNRRARGKRKKRAFQRLSGRGFQYCYGPIPQKRKERKKTLKKASPFSPERDKEGSIGIRPKKGIFACSQRASPPGKRGRGEGELKEREGEGGEGEPLLEKMFVHSLQ